MAGSGRRRTSFQEAGGARFPGDTPAWSGGSPWRPVVDMYETEKSVVIRAELAGVHRQDVRVSLDGGTVRIRGERRPPESAHSMQPHCMEIAFGPFERAIAVETPFDRDQVSARLEDGFLEIVLQKTVSATRRIPVRRDPS